MRRDKTIIVVGNYHKCQHEASRVLCPYGIAPTIKENHGTVNAIVLWSGCFKCERK